MTAAMAAKTTPEIKPFNISTPQFSCSAFIEELPIQSV
jgi:hypothetical protein